MPAIQRNPSTNEVYYNTLTKKVIMTTFPCVYCGSMVTPERVQFTLTGLKCCFGFGSCCDDSKFVVMNEGIGWNGSMILTQGHVWTLDGVTKIRVEDNCYWSEIEFGDFGQMNEYEGEDCGGAIVNIWRGVAKMYEFRRNLAGVVVYVYLFWKNQLNELWYYGPYAADKAGSWAKCLPYGVEINNSFTCPNNYIDYYCAGDGKVVLTEIV